MTPTEGRPGWRDVYRAVGESEERIKDAIREAVQPLADKASDHEERLRKIESGDLPWVNRLDKSAQETHADQGRRLGAVEQKVEFYTNRESGILSTLSAGQKFVLMLIGIITASGVVVDILTRLAS